ncbi:uncharacterized protein LOC131655472 [Vicia villosa]|uniref:uncharacterized protein LOC131655472 n=1 Tax=Vicia villosa TaxID=3911 RepID=UPI00273B780D|nr:uncharacterized protein LOC131655472 [Vicia villosa]
MAQYSGSGTNVRAENAFSLISSGSQSGIEPTCMCGSIAVIRLVKKKGRNLGKLFWGYIYFKDEHDNVGCNFFMWYENQQSDEGKPETPPNAFLMCFKCDKKEVQIKMLMKDDTYNKEMMNNVLKMLKMLFYAMICLILIIVVLICMLFKNR